MLISGFEKNTLLDYPGKVASIVFTHGCNLRCSYCHNPELVIEECKRDFLIEDNTVLDYLKEREGLIDALVITGGEPTLQRDLISFIEKVKDLNLLVKVDTNGVYTDTIRKIIKKGIVDYWAMDVKYPSEYYEEYDIDTESIKGSIEAIMNSGKEYEFRTTYVKGIHSIEDAKSIGELISGAQNYYIQNFRKGKTIDTSLNNTNSFTQEELERIKDNVSKYVENVTIR